MTLTWLGQNCFKIEGKSGSLVLNPFISTKTQRLPKNADAFLFVRPMPEKDVAAITGESLSITTPGEYEIKELLIAGQPAGDKGETVFRIVADGVHVGYIGEQATFDEAAADLLEGVDVLVLPVGGGVVLDASGAGAVVSKIEPRIVVPIETAEMVGGKQASVEQFCKELGITKPDAVKKLSLLRKDLPADETMLVLFES
ncbi:MAG: MBL fold metallo-hydrolase [Patescibacteria group bacterium]